MPPQKKRVRKSRDELHQKEAADKHSTLVHMSTKSLRKEAKVVKTFQCQKIVRKIKELKETLSVSDSASGMNEKSGDEKAQRKLHALDEKLKATKEFDIDCIVQVALRRLGLNNESDNEIGNEDKQSASDIFTKETIETMLKHKRLSTAMNSVSEKVSEYNAWLSRREDWLASKKGKINNLNEKEDSKKRGKNIFKTCTARLDLAIF
jgi:hypothetical protein